MLWGDSLLVDHSFSYRAVASSETVRVAKIPLATIASVFINNSQMRSYWLHQAQVRERVIVFRTLTALRSHPSRPLRQWMSYLRVLHLSAGDSLRAVTPTADGRYWLRCGEIANNVAGGSAGDSDINSDTDSDTENKKALLPTVGDSWGYKFDDCGEHWVAW